MPLPIATVGPMSPGDSPSPSAASKAAGNPVTDELVVRNLVADLSRNADVADVATYLSSFAPDARWNMPGAPVHGHAEIRAGLIARRERGEGGPGTHTRHMVSTVAVAVDGDAATADSYFQFFTDTNTQPVLRLVGAYHDTFVRTPDGWKLAQRDITLG